MLKDAPNAAIHWHSYVDSKVLENSKLFVTPSMNQHDYNVAKPVNICGKRDENNFYNDSDENCSPVSICFVIFTW